MQLQIEHASSPEVKSSCVLCNQFFTPDLARVIVCRSDGSAWGDLCTNCLAQGSGFIRTRLQAALHYQAGIVG
jgi:hypothetical protein